VTGVHGTSAPGACSVGFDQADLSAYGTAARAVFWVALEQEGPWGRVAATESHLPPQVGRRLDEQCASRGGRLLLLRRPGRHPDPRHGDGRTAYLAFSGDDPWLLAVHGASLDELAAVDLDALARGDRAAVRASLPAAAPADAVLLVCTNGRRDVCCALRGRPVALDAAGLAPGRVWESSHTGGHRFAPTAVLLPHGVALARLDAQRSAEVLEAADAGRLPTWALGPRHDRGRSALPAAAQAAESHVRALAGETSLAALATRVVEDTTGAAHRDDATAREVVEVSHPDGRRWVVAVERRPAGPALPESCGKPPIPVQEWFLSLL
jgi:hypothetical protein